jgi:hypothetical protein
MKILFVTATLAGIGLSAGCGSGPSAEACGIAPCGGDVVGDWTASSACIDSSILEEGILKSLKGACPSLTLGAVDNEATGTLALGADMAFTGTLASNSTMQVNYPTACVSNTTCENLTVGLQATVGAAGIKSVSCTGTATCVCTFALTIDIVNGSGMWATSGTTLTFSGLPLASGPYCVKGSSLHLIGYDIETSTKIVSDFVVTKQ